MSQNKKVYFYKLVLMYDGSGFYGWQKQAEHLKGLCTIQGELEKVLKKISKTTEVKTIGCGRTDAGVHSRYQVVKVELHVKIPELSLKKAVNSLINDKIKVTSCCFSSSDFHPVFDAKNKEYRYYFTFDECYPWLNNYITRFKTKHIEIDLNQVRNFISLFLGRHDFVNFCTTGTEVKSTIRTIYDIELVRCVAGDFPFFYMPEDVTKIYMLRVVGAGFLKQMVRIIMGTVLSFIFHKITKEDLADAFQTKYENGRKLGIVAPANGLYLYHVEY